MRTPTEYQKDDFITKNKTTALKLKQGGVYTVIDEYNNVDNVMFLGVSDLEQESGRSGVKFNSLKEAMKHYGMKKIAEIHDTWGEYGVYHGFHLFFKLLDGHGRFELYTEDDGKWYSGEGRTDFYNAEIKKEVKTKKKLGSFGKFLDL